MNRIRSATLCLALVTGVASLAWATANRQQSPDQHSEAKKIAENQHARMMAYQMGFKSFGELLRAASR